MQSFSFSRCMNMKSRCRCASPSMTHIAVNIIKVQENEHKLFAFLQTDVLLSHNHEDEQNTSIEREKALQQHQEHDRGQHTAAGKVETTADQEQYAASLWKVIQQQRRDN